ncbi:growth hormone secretagogue receptor type 1-like [Gigantopelta aegis]|uniref:growth hormone secretagogue receptor type 1-like n=1 Tax=Gigantopelta aegis TaxID=1735272 RepID=UPI001B888BE6|nr:growth hormone secretagogue receptor type 1-like [Gigantopelta aegis]
MESVASEYWNSSLSLESTTAMVDTIVDPGVLHLQYIRSQIQNYYLWVIFALGFPGNCATIVTVIRMSPPRSLTVYIVLLAVVDNLALINKILIIALLVDLKVQIGDVGCRMFGFFGNFLATFANWLLVAMSIERFAAVWFPFHVGQWWTFRKSLVVLAAVAVPLIGLFLHYFWTFHFVYDAASGSVACVHYYQYVAFISIFEWYNVAIYAFIPCFLLLVFNILVIHGIIRSTKSRRYLNGSNGSGSGCLLHQRQVTIMLVTAAIVLLVFTTPRCVLLILANYWKPDPNTMEHAWKDLADQISFILCDSTHAINFYLYSLSAKKFRFHFFDLVMCRRTSMAHSTFVMSLSSRPSGRKTPQLRSHHDNGNTVHFPILSTDSRRSKEAAVDENKADESSKMLKDQALVKREPGKTNVKWGRVCF